MSSRGFSEIVLTVEDVPKASRFYQEVVGLELELEPETDDTRAWFFAGSDDRTQRLAVHRGPLMIEQHSVISYGRRGEPALLTRRRQVGASALGR